MPADLQPVRRRATVRVDHGPELLYVQRDGRTVRTLSHPNGLADLDPLDHHFLQALCLHVLNRLGMVDYGPDGEHGPVNLGPRRLAPFPPDPLDPREKSITGGTADAPR